MIGISCGTLAAACWALGFVVAKHGIETGFSPADIAFHRFFWSGVLVLPMLLRSGLRSVGGVSWPRGLTMSLFAGPPQSLIAYSGFILVPLGHGTTIQPACAALAGFIFAAAFLREHVSPRRIFGAVTIIGGLLVFGAESFATMGGPGVAGDLLFVMAGVFWASFGTLVRHWSVPGTQAVVVVSAVSMLLFAPAYFAIYGVSALARHGLFENLLQALVQGGLAGVLPIYLFTHAVFALGAGRAATFTALVPLFGVSIGFIALGVVPTLAQLAGMAIVLLGFQFTLRQ